MEVHIAARPLLHPEEIRQMEQLYRIYYTGAPSDAFRRDLDGKDFVILLRDRERVEGFSTQRILAVGGRTILFSGDTVVDAGARRQFGLAGGFGHLMTYLQTHRCRPEELYWFLISKGARTYRFLPTFFRHFQPNDQHAHPELIPLLLEIARTLYPREFDPATGVLHFPEGDRLRQDDLRQDPDSVFFRNRNPGWADGDELCCLAPLALDNLNACGLRVIRAVTPQWRLEP